MFFGKKEEPNLKILERIKLFLACHWRGVILILAPLIFLGAIWPPTTTSSWAGYTLLLMAVFWVTECIPLTVTGFLPMLIFPVSGVMTTAGVCAYYINDSVMMFLGSLILASSVEQSGLHKRLAYLGIRTIGYSHLKLLLAMCIVTTFVSMWITNTAATSMMVPIVFAVLRVFENEGLLKIYDKSSEGSEIASDITTCYFCAVTYSATNGGIGTIVGTATNLVFKSLFQSQYAEAPEYLSFPLFSAFGIILMVILEAGTYIYLGFMYFGMFRKESKLAKAAIISEKGKKAAALTINTDWKKIGKISYWEWMVILLFGGAIIAFFCRSPQVFKGWGDAIVDFFELENAKFVKDSALAMLAAFLMMLLPANLIFLKNITAKYHEHLPKKPIRAVLDWKLMNASLPYSFMFLLGGGTALSKGADSSGFNAKLGESLEALASLPNYLIILMIVIFTIFVTNFASNVAVCNVFSPIAMNLAEKCKVNPLWYVIAAGFSSSFCYMLPVGTPGNLVVQVQAKIPTRKMVIAGFGPTVWCIVMTWFCICFYAPIVWPDLRSLPEWASPAPAD